MKQAGLMSCVSDPSYKEATDRKIMIQGKTQDSLGNTIGLDINIIKEKMEWGEHGSWTCLARARS
jgi:hypothetical protein